VRLQESDARDVVGEHQGHAQGGAIEFASSYYTLCPGDVIMTGTPAGVGPVQPGDVMVAEVVGVGRMEVRVVADEST
jgi:2-keto-4-pentenoate hydratase/2-oxohepta-3-ene-1,7-dioic acid hydratase in catechol pathway